LSWFFLLLFVDVAADGHAGDETLFVFAKRSAPAAGPRWPLAFSKGEFPAKLVERD